MIIDNLLGKKLSMGTKRSRPNSLQNVSHKKQRVKLIVDTFYTSSDTILVVGDGDFSFSKGLVAHRSTGKNLIATSYDSESQVKKKYSNALENIKAIRSNSGNVLHNIDATNLQATLPSTAYQTQLPNVYDYIIFNFPHSGQQRVHINRLLLHDFFTSARDKLTMKGEVHVSLKTKPPYSNWCIEEQAKKAGFVLKQRRPFKHNYFPGYKHRTTDPHAKTFEPDDCITYIFIVNRSKYPMQLEEVNAKNKLNPEYKNDWNHVNKHSFSTDSFAHHKKESKAVNAKVKKGKKKQENPVQTKVSPTHTKWVGVPAPSLDLSGIFDFS